MVLQSLEMASEKTKVRLISAAKILFIRNGFDNTTMCDIANASGIGRRTLYTYFGNKINLYQTVINVELDMIIDELNIISTSDISPGQKILDVIFGRFRILKEAVYRNGTLRSGFFRDIWMVEHFRKDFDNMEKRILIKIISDGKTEGSFHVGDVKLAAELIQYCMRGFEAPYIRGHLGNGKRFEDLRREVKKIIYGALGCNIN